MRDGAALGVVEARVVHAVEPEHHADRARLGQERGVVHEAPQREEAVQLPGLA